MKSKADSGTIASPNMNGIRSLTCPTIATGVPAWRLASSSGRRSTVTSGFVPRLTLAPVRRHASRDLLRDHVRAGRRDRARDMRVVDARVGLLRERRRQVGAGFHEELVDRDVRGQGALQERQHPFRFRHVAEHARGHRLDEAPFEFAVAVRPVHREAVRIVRSIAGSAGGAAVELVDERDGLAGRDRRAQHDALADPRQHLLDAVLQVGD